MSGPTTRPIRDDRPKGLDGRLLDYAASDEGAGHDRRYQYQQQKSRDPAKDTVRHGAVWAALLAIVPERFRPMARLLLGCTICMFIAALYVVGSVEWHYVPLWQARTASADELRKLEARVTANEADSAMSLRLLQQSRMMALQDIICRDRDIRLVLELQELQYDYKRRNRTDYPLQSCRKDTPTQ